MTLYVWCSAMYDPLSVHTLLYGKPEDGRLQWVQGSIAHRMLGKFIGSIGTDHSTIRIVAIWTQTTSRPWIPSSGYQQILSSGHYLAHTIQPILSSRHHAVNRYSPIGHSQDAPSAYHTHVIRLPLNQITLLLTEERRISAVNIIIRRL